MMWQRVDGIGQEGAGFGAMKRFVAVGLAVTLGLWGSAVYAFEETPVAGAGNGTAAAPATSGSGTATPSLDLAPPAGTASGASGGTDVKVPGLGSIGVLPKLDFGLELLYGKTDTLSEEPVDDPNNLTFGGRLRHKF